MSIFMEIGILLMLYLARMRSQATKVEQISSICLVLDPFQIPSHHDPGSLGTLLIFSCSQNLRLEDVRELSGQCYSNQNQQHCLMMPKFRFLLFYYSIFLKEGLLFVLRY